MFHTLIELERYEGAFVVYRDRLEYATLYRLSASRLRIELVERLFADLTRRMGFHPMPSSSRESASATTKNARDGIPCDDDDSAKCRVPLPRLSRPRDQSYTLNSLALAYQYSGQPGTAVPVFRRTCEVDEQEQDQGNFSVDLCNLSDAERLSGEVHAAEASARAALRITRVEKNELDEGVSLYLLGLALAVRGASRLSLRGGREICTTDFQSVASEGRPASRDGLEVRRTDAELRPFDRSPAAGSVASPKTDGLVGHPTGDSATSIATDAWTALEQSLQLQQKRDDNQCEGLVNASMAEVALWLGDWATARTLADRAWELAAVQRLEGDFIRAARLQGTAALRGWVARSEPSNEGRGASSDFVGELLRNSPPSRGATRPQSQADHPDAPTAEFAHERLLHALTRARACQLVEEELPPLIALAELHEAWARRALHLSWSTIPSCSNSTATAATPKTSAEEHFGNVLHVSQPDASAFRLMGLTATEHLTEARRFLDDVWDRAQRGPYPMFHADAFNQLASLERLTLQVVDAELATNPSSERRQHLLAQRTQSLNNAQHAAVKAYEFAWLDGPPFAYAHGLEQATEHLQSLGLPLPQLKLFDESQYPPMPDVPIIPPQKRKRARKKTS